MVDVELRKRMGVARICWLGFQEATELTHTRVRAYVIVVDARTRHSSKSVLHELLQFLSRLAKRRADFVLL